MKSIAIVLSVVMFCLIVRFFIENSLPHYRIMTICYMARFCSRITEVLGLLLTGERFFTVWVRIGEEADGEFDLSAAEMEMKAHAVIVSAALGASGPEEMKRVMELASAEAARMSVREYAKMFGACCIVAPRLLEEEEAAEERKKESGAEKKGGES